MKGMRPQLFLAGHWAKSGWSAFQVPRRRMEIRSLIASVSQLSLKTHDDDEIDSQLKLLGRLTSSAATRESLVSSPINERPLLALSALGRRLAKAVCRNSPHVEYGPIYACQHLWRAMRNLCVLHQHQDDFHQGAWIEDLLPALSVLAERILSPPSFDGDAEELLDEDDKVAILHDCAEALLAGVQFCCNAITCHDTNQQLLWSRLVMAPGVFVSLVCLPTTF